jgi:molybdopterin-binding protein
VVAVISSAAPGLLRVEPPEVPLDREAMMPRAATDSGRGERAAVPRQKIRICGFLGHFPTAVADTLWFVSIYRMADAASLLGISDDTMRRWADAGRFALARTDDGHAGIEGVELARLAREVAAIPPDGAEVASHRVSARNHLRGIVTGVKRDTVMAQVEMCCGPYRVVSLMSREAADALGLEPGVVAVASIKATNVVVEVPS